MFSAILAAALLAPSAPCPVTLPNGTAVRGGFAPARATPDFTIINREASYVLVKLEQVESGEDHVFFVAPGAEVTIRWVTLGTYQVSVAVAGRLASDCRMLASAKAVYRFSEPFVFARRVIENPDGTRDTQMDSHWIELGNDDLNDARAATISIGTFND